MLGASFFDPSNNGIDFTDIAGLLGLVILIGTIVGAVSRIASKKMKQQADAMESRLLAALTEATQPIQPGYRNGGESLADVAADTKTLKANQADIKETVASLQGLLLQHVTNHELHGSAADA